MGLLAYEGHASLHRGLTNWHGKALNFFTTSKVINIVTTQLKNGVIPGLAPELLPGCKKDNILYNDASTFGQDIEVTRSRDANYSKNIWIKRSSIWWSFRNICSLQDNWSFNTTLLDIDWYDALADKDAYDIGFDPFQSLGAFQDENLPTKPDNPPLLFDYFSPFFLDAANSIKQLRERSQWKRLLAASLTLLKEFALVYMMALMMWREFQSGRSCQT